MTNECLIGSCQVKTEIQEENEGVTKVGQVQVLYYYTVSTLEDACTGTVVLVGSGK